MHNATGVGDPGLKIVGLATERCHAVKGPNVRVYFRLSETPPVGWAYIFSIMWQVLQYPLKLQAGVEEGAVWIECNPGEVGPLHLKVLDKVVGQTNQKFRQSAEQKAVNQAQQAEMDVRMRAQLEQLGRTLFPQSGASQAKPSGARASSLKSRLARLFRWKRAAHAPSPQ